MHRYSYDELIEKGNSRHSAEKILHDQELQDAYVTGKRAILDHLMYYMYGLAILATVIAAFVPKLHAESVMIMGVLCSTLVGVFRFSIRE